MLHASADNDQILSLRLHILLLQASFFDDFTFEPMSIASPYFLNGDMGYTFDLSEIKLSISKGLKMSSFDERTNTIQLLPEHTQDDNVLLHEMIHAFESIICEKLPALREILALQLYKKLSAVHPDLDEYLDHFLNRKTFRDISEMGGTHGALFALKALDIDDQKGWKPGTTFGYIEYSPAG